MAGAGLVRERGERDGQRMIDKINRGVETIGGYCVGEGRGLDRAREDGYFGRLASAWGPIIKCHIGTEMIDVSSYIAAKGNKWGNKWGLWVRKLVYCYSADVDLDFLRNNWRECPRRR
jgi:hypothetical protein